MNRPRISLLSQTVSALITATLTFFVVGCSEEKEVAVDPNTPKERFQHPERPAPIKPATNPAPVTEMTKTREPEPDPMAEGQRKLDKLYELAESKDAESLYTLGQYFFAGNMVEQNFSTAADYFHRAAELDHTAAMTTLGTMYGEGRGVARSMQKAGQMFTKAAKLGDPLAQTSLAQMYLRGMGVRKNHGMAFRWSKQAAMNGDPFGQAQLGGMYLMGQGTAKNPPQAVEWFTASAKQGLATAQVNLGNLYRTGAGVEKDTTEAYKWFLLAARQKDANGARAAKALESSLSATEQLEGQKRADEFKVESSAIDR